jgi:hypothetical protein
MAYATVFSIYIRYLLYEQTQEMSHKFQKNLRETALFSYQFCRDCRTIFFMGLSVVELVCFMLGKWVKYKTATLKEQQDV